MKGRERKVRASVRADFTDDRAEVYQVCLSEIEKKHGYVKPEIIVEEAKSKKSPLHEYFEWDDSRASALYRLTQARYLIRHIVVIVEDKEPIRQYHNVKLIEQPDKQGYVSVEQVKTNDEYASQVIEKARMELIGWRKRYKAYEKEFGLVFDAIDSVQVQQSAAFVGA